MGLIIPSVEVLTSIGFVDVLKVACTHAQTHAHTHTCDVITTPPGRSGHHYEISP